jgi:hypothetical protein
MPRPFAVTILALLNFAGSLFLFVLAAVFAIGATAASGPSEPAAPIVLAICAVITGGMAIFQLATGIGLWTLKNYGRIGQLILSAIGLLAIPLGTLVSAIVLYYLTRPGVQLLFSGRSEASLTLDERQVVARDANQAVAMIIVLVVAIFGGIAMLGIVAAIAIPGLLRARMSGNEASAIGTVRSVTSAQAAWASSHGGAYATPACLHDPVSCGEPAGASPFLNHDPTAGPPQSGYRYGFAQRAAVAAEAPATDPTIPNIEGLTPEQVERVVADMQAKADAQAAQAAAAAPAGYVIWAVPEKQDITGIRSFCADETGIVLEYRRGGVWSDPHGDAARCPEGGEPLR